MTAEKRILVAGVGNVLKADDGFGVVVANHLMKHAKLPASTKVIETGIGGMTLIQELMDGYNLLILLDAFQRGGKPGELYVLEPVLPDLSDLSLSERRDYFADTHYATPMRALSLLEHISKMPDIVRIVGCEPKSLEELQIGLSPEVENAVEPATRLIHEVIENFLARWSEEGVHEKP